LNYQLAKLSFPTSLPGRDFEFSKLKIFACQESGQLGAPGRLLT